MNARPAIAAYIAAGHTDTDIADQLGVHRTTANRARHRLTAADRLAAEAIPIRPAPAPRLAWTPEEQAAHRAQLLAALRGEAA